MLKKKITKVLPILLASFTLLAACTDSEGDVAEQETPDQAEDETSEIIDFSILATSDVHAHLYPFDYMNGVEDDSIGLSKIFTLVEEARAEYDHTLLVDNGDIIQGSILGNMPVDVKPLQEGEKHVVMEAMNEMGYVSSTFGNHEFNFGLDFLNDTIEDAEFPWLSANIVEPGTQDPVFKPYTIVDVEVGDEILSVGLIGFTPPAIMEWDSLHLEGEVETIEIKDAAEIYIPQMKEEGADLIIAVAHTGIDDGEDMSSDAAIPLSEVDGIDGMVLGHDHGRFPMEEDEDYASMEGVDHINGTINGVPAVMPGSWGSYLGVLHFQLVFEDGEWTVDSAQSELRSTEGVASHTKIEEIAKTAHEETVEYVKSPVGEITDTIHTYFARVADNEVVQLVNDAQLDYLKQLKADGELEEDLPLLSAGAPFRAGRDGEFTNISEGEISIGDMNDVYVYPNTMNVVEVNGDELKNWLEFSALNFNQIDPDEEGDQQLVNEEERSYNFDVIENVTYAFDVTKPVGERVVDLAYNGEAVTTDDRFYVATNNHRTSGGDLGENVKIALETTMENRQIIMDYVINHEGPLDIVASQNWSIIPFETSGNVIFKSDKNGVDYVDEYENIEFYEENDEGVYFLYN